MFCIVLFQQSLHGVHNYYAIEYSEDYFLISSKYSAICQSKMLINLNFSQKGNVSVNILRGIRVCAHNH